MALILPPEPMKKKSYHPRLFICYYEDDVKSFYKICEKEKAKFICHLSIPFFNVWGSQVGKQYAIIYANDKEIEMEVMC